MKSICHFIATIRPKQDYVLSEKNGKMVPEKIGLKSVTREGLDYEFSLVFELDLKHQATATKDRTELFLDKPSFMISSEVEPLVDYKKIDLYIKQMTELLNI